MDVGCKESDTIGQMNNKELTDGCLLLADGCNCLLLEGNSCYLVQTMGYPGGSGVKNPPATQKFQETKVLSLGQEDPLEEEMASHSSILARKIPWTEEPSRLQSIRRVAELDIMSD